MSFNSLKHQPFGPSYGTFKASLLQDDIYIQLINTEYPKWLTEFSNVLDKRVLWDLVKYRIRQTTIKYSKQIAKNRKSQLHACEQNLKQCEENCSLDPSEENTTKMDTVKNDYGALYEHIIQGKIVGSRINWYEKGEKNSKYFQNLEINKFRKTWIRRLLDTDRKLILNSNGIPKELEHFYKALYSNQDAQDHKRFFPEFLENDHIPKLGVVQKILCEGKLWIQERFNALSHFLNGKSPGNDGLTSEFYEKFWNLLGQLLTGSLNFSCQHGELSNSHKQAIIRLIGCGHTTELNHDLAN